MALWCVGIRFHRTGSGRKTGHAWYVAESVLHPVAFSREHLCWVRILPPVRGRTVRFFRLRCFTSWGILKVEDGNLIGIIHLLIECSLAREPYWGIFCRDLGMRKPLLICNYNICRLRGGVLGSNEKEGKNALNDNINYCLKFFGH